MEIQDTSSHSINFRDKILLQRKDAFMANQLERPSERRDVTTCLPIHLILGWWLVWSARVSQKNGSHLEVYLGISLWEELSDVRQQRTWKLRNLCKLSATEQYEISEFKKFRYFIEHPELEGTHKDHQVQLSVGFTEDHPKPNPTSENVVQTLLELHLAWSHIHHLWWRTLS